MADAPARFQDLSLDAVDHQALADWRCTAIGYVRRSLTSPISAPGEPAGPDCEKVGPWATIQSPPSPKLCFRRHR